MLAMEGIMLRFLSARDLSRDPRLQNSMYRDRACQFRDRLGWKVAVDARGWEWDEYDRLNPLYVIWELPDGTHGGSMRFLPTTGRTMVNEHFSHLLPTPDIRDANIWECTRFCLSQRAGADISTLLMLGAAQVGLSFGLTQAIGVFDARMIRLYRLLGWRPQVIGAEGEGEAAIGVGLWTFSEGVRLRLALKAQLDPDRVTGWFNASAGDVKAVA
jgi:acyl homoserine lactone synthase